jgi:protein O-mannosyl-transferase
MSNKRVKGPRIPAAKSAASLRARESATKSPNANFLRGRFTGCALFVAIFCATLAAYLPALHGSRVWDDNNHVTRPDLRSLHGLWRIWFDLGATQQYYPLLHSAFWLEHQMWGNTVVGYHLTNIVLHALSACLVVIIVRRLSLPGAWLAGFVFALHPVQVESVAWITEQKNTLSGVFFLAALLAYLYFEQDRRKPKYMLATALFVLALLSKTVTATLPVVLVVILWWRRGRLAWKRDVLYLLPWFVLGATAGLFSSWVERTSIGAQGSSFLLTPVQRVLIAGRDICFYLGKLFWPINLAFFYPRWNVDPAVWWQWLFPLGVLAVAAGLVFAAQRDRGPLAGFLIFTGALFPVLGFLNLYFFRYSYVADHFQYLALLGVIVPVIALLATATERARSGKTVIISCFVLLILVLGILSWRQSQAYRDTETLYRTSLEHNPDSSIAHYNLGTLLANKPGQLQEVIEQYEAALQIDPEQAEVHNNLGIALSRIPGQLPKAIANYEAALRIQPDYEAAHLDLGNALSRVSGRLQDAIVEYRVALRINPDDAQAHYDLGNLLSGIPGRLPDAIAEYRAAFRVEPDFAEAHFNLGNALSRISSRSQDAIAEYQTALHIRPDFVEAHNNLGLMLSRIPARLPDAIAEYQAALRIRSDYAEAHFNLANALAQMPGQTEDAIAEYQTAQRIRPDYAGVVSERLKELRASRSVLQK